MIVKCHDTNLYTDDTRGKSYGITIMDCTGNVQFHDDTEQMIVS